MTAPVLSAIEWIALIVAGAALVVVGGVAVLLPSWILGATFVVASLVWLPFIVPYFIDTSRNDRSELERWVEVDRRRFEMSDLLAAADALESGPAEAVHLNRHDQLARRRPRRPGQR